MPKPILNRAKLFLEIGMMLSRMVDEYDYDMDVSTSDINLLPNIQMGNGTVVQGYDVEFSDGQGFQILLVER